MTNVAATDAFGVVADALSQYATQNGNTALSGIFKWAGDASSTYAVYLEENPVQAAAAMTVGLFAVAALGPEATVATAVSALASTLETRLALLGITSSTANSIANAAISAVIAEGGQQLFNATVTVANTIVSALGGALASISVSGSTNMIPSNSSSNPNLIVAAAPDASGNTSELLISLPTPSQDSTSTALVTQNNSKLAPGTPGYNTDEYTGSTITFLGNDNQYHTANVLYLNSNGTAYVVDNVSGEGTGSTSVGTALVTHITPPSGSVPEVLGSQITDNSNGSQTNQAFGTNGNVQYTDTTTTTSGGQITDAITGQGAVNDLSNSSISLAAGAAATVAGNSDSIAAAAGSAVTVTGTSDSVNASGTGDSVNASNTTITFAANATGTITGNSDTISGTGSGQSITVSGTGDVENISNATITLANGASCTITGSHDTIIFGNSDSVTVGGSSNTLDVNGSNSSVTDSGSGDSITMTGSGDSATATGANDGITLQGSSETGAIQGSGDSLTATGATDVCYVQGANETGTLQGNGDNLTVAGSNDTAYIQGTSETGTAINANETIYVTGNSSAAYLQAGSESGSLSGTGDSITVTGTGSNAVASGSSDSLYLQGTGESGTISGTGTGNGIQVTGASDAATLQGTNESAGIHGSGDNATLTGATDSLSMYGTSETGTAQGTSDSIIVTSSGDTAYLQGYQETASLQSSSDSAIVSGNNDTASLQGNADSATVSGSADAANLYSTNELVNSSVTGETINVLGSTSGTWDTFNVSHDTVNLSIQDTVKINGSYNTENGTYDLLDFSGTNDLLNASYSLISDFNTAGDWLTGWYDVYNGYTESGSYNGPDPIVLNLAGQEVQTVGMTQSNTYFDVLNNGSRILTGWVTAGEGLLVYDPTNSNSVTSEANLVSGFSQLSTYDSNGDGVLNVQDSAWSKLKVWVDKAGIGNFDSGSLYTLDQLGITSINLNAKQVNQDSNGNAIVADSSFTLAKGGSGDIAGVSFLDAPKIGTSAGPTANPGQLTTSAFNQLVSAAAAFNPPPSGVPTVVANDNLSQSTQLAASH